MVQAPKILMSLDNMTTKFVSGACDWRKSVVQLEVHDAKKEDKKKKRKLPLKTPCEYFLLLANAVATYYYCTHLLFSLPKYVNCICFEVEIF